MASNYSRLPSTPAEFALVGPHFDARLPIGPVIDRRPARALGEPATVGFFAADAIEGIKPSNICATATLCAAALVVAGRRGRCGDLLGANLPSIHGADAAAHATPPRRPPVGADAAAAARAVAGRPRARPVVRIGAAVAHPGPVRDPDRAARAAARELGQFSWERRAEAPASTSASCRWRRRRARSTASCSSTGSTRCSAVDGGSRRQHSPSTRWRCTSGPRVRRARAALLRRLWQRAMAEFDTDDADAARAARRRRGSSGRRSSCSASARRRWRCARGSRRRRSARRRPTKCASGRCARAGRRRRAQGRGPRACRLEAELGALRGLVEAAAALAAREARNGNGEEALRRVSGMLARRRRRATPRAWR